MHTIRRHPTGAAALVASTLPATAAIDLIDDRKARANGFDLIYEARDLDLPQNVRDGLTQARQDLAATKKRIAESEKRIDTLLPPAVSKAYWTEAREELRRQVGVLRFDINTVADTLPKDAKKALLKEKNEFFALVEDLDLALVQKKKDVALEKLPKVQSKLDSVIAKLG